MVAVVDHFINKVVLAETDCWLWGEYVKPDGYAVFRIPRAEKVPAHRFAYESFRGPIPEGLTLDHLCRVRHCVNPWHLEPVTQRENILRGMGPPALNSRKTHCKRGHSLGSDGSVYINPKGERICRVCQNETTRRYRERKKLRQSQGDQAPTT
jgi:hypothetical protein